MIEIDNDVGNVAQSLRDIDSHICLRFSEAGGYFVAYWRPSEWDEGEGYLITTAQDCDHRLVKRVEDIYAKCKQPGYSFATELEKVEAEGKREREHKQREESGEALEKLAHAMRADLGYNQSKIAT